MSEHLHTIGQKSNASYQQVNHNEELLLNIQQLGEQVNHINAQAAENAQSTYLGITHPSAARRRYRSPKVQITRFRSTCMC